MTTTESTMLRRSDRQQPTDAKTLAFLIERLRPSIVGGICQTIDKKFEALKTLVVRQEQLLASAPDFEGKITIMQHLTVARVLCEHIQNDVISSSDNWSSHNSHDPDSAA